jgi:hydroxyethylthiazole kinase-like uncharacterized protein yjeF
LGDAVRADCTVSFGLLKAGLLLEPGADYAGSILLADIGLSAANAGSGYRPKPALRIAQAADVASLLPRRPAGGHKGSNGHLAILAGSLEMAGAAVLTANAAIRAGAGLVTLLIGEEAWSRLEGLRPEVMLAPVGSHGDGRFTAFAVGPGLGRSEAAQALVRLLWSSEPRPMIVDADGLNALVGFDGLPGGSRLLTPHPGEAGRLLACSAAEVQADRIAAVRALAQRSPTLLKGRHTLVCGRGDEAPWLNPTGGPQLATAGSGDVLTGIAGAFLAQGLAAIDAGLCAAFVHGLSAADREGPIVAGDVIEGIPDAFGAVAGTTSLVQSVGP